MSQRHRRGATTRRDSPQETRNHATKKLDTALAVLHAGAERQPQQTSGQTETGIRAGPHNFQQFQDSLKHKCPFVWQPTKVVRVPKSIDLMRAIPALTLGMLSLWSGIKILLAIFYSADRMPLGERKPLTLNDFRRNGPRIKVPLWSIGYEDFQG